MVFSDDNPVLREGLRQIVTVYMSIYFLIFLILFGYIRPSLLLATVPSRIITLLVHLKSSHEWQLQGGDPKDLDHPAQADTLDFVES